MNTRISTGVRNVTLALPGLQHNSPGWHGQFYHGAFNDEFRLWLKLVGLRLHSLQWRRLEHLNQLLKAHNDEIDTISYNYYCGHDHNFLYRFVALCRNNTLVWEKYEGNVSGGGRATIYAGGLAFYATAVDRFDAKEFEKMVSGKYDKKSFNVFKL